LSIEEKEEVKGVFETAIENKNMTVKVESMSTDELPVVITMIEFMRRMKDIAKLGGRWYCFIGEMPDQYSVAVNANHRIVQRIIRSETEEDKLKLAKQSYDLALLSQNMLTGADLTRFIRRGVELVS